MIGPLCLKTNLSFKQHLGSIFIKMNNILPLFHVILYVSISSPEQVVSLDAQNIVAVSCGEAHTLALNDKGQVFAWGLGSDGQLGLSIVEDCLRVPR